MESRMRRLIGGEGVLTLGSSRTVIVERLVVEQSSEVARFGGLEGVQVVDYENEQLHQHEYRSETQSSTENCPRRLTMRLLRIEGRPDPIVHDDQSSPILAVGKDSGLDSSVEVGGSVSGEGGGGAHGADDDDGLAAIDREVHCLTGRCVTTKIKGRMTEMS
jgi:hypothetical protein